MWLQFLVFSFSVANVCSLTLCPAGNISYDSYTSKRTEMTHSIRSRLTMCVANCLDLSSPTKPKLNKKPCEYSQKTANVVGEPCTAQFVPSRSDKKILCQHFSEESSYVTKNPTLKVCDFMTFEFIAFDLKNNTLEAKGDHLTAILAQMEDARKLGIQNILTLGSWDDVTMSAKSFSAVSGNANLGKKFSESLTKMIQTYKLEGIFVRWFWPGCPQFTCKNPEDKENVISFFKKIISPLKKQFGLKIFFYLPLSLSPATFLGDYYSEISPIVDFFPIESANQGGLWLDTVEFNNNLKKTNFFLNSIIKLAANAPNLADKVLYEISAQARAYELRLGAKPKIGASMDKGSKIQHLVDFSEHCQFLKNKSFIFVKDAASMNFAYSGRYIFTYEDPATLRAKADYILEKGGGFYISNVEADDDDESCGCKTNLPFLRAAAETLKGRECILPPCF